MRIKRASVWFLLQSFVTVACPDEYRRAMPKSKKEEKETKANLEKDSIENNLFSNTDFRLAGLFTSLVSRQRK